MRKTDISPPPKAKNLAQQKTDFTAEGSPLPGNVGIAPPLNDAHADEVPAVPTDPSRKPTRKT